MSADLPAKGSLAVLTRRRALAGLMTVAVAGAVLAGCSGSSSYFSSTPLSS